MHRNEELLRTAYDEFSRGDLETIRRDSTADLVWHVRGSTGFAGDRVGPDDVIKFLGDYMQLTAFSFTLDVLRVFADDDYAIVLCQQAGMAAGHPIDSLVTHVYRFRDGKICEGWFLIDRQLEVEAALREAIAGEAVEGLMHTIGERTA